MRRRRHAPDSCGPDLGEVGQQGLLDLGEDLGSRRHGDLDVGAAGTPPGLAHAGTAVLALEKLLVAVGDEAADPRHGRHPNIASLAVIAPIGTVELDEFLAPKRVRPGAAVAGPDVDLGLIEKL